MSGSPAHATEPPSGRSRRDGALVLIIAYKLVKAVLWLVFAVVILGSMRAGLSDRLLGLAQHLRHHSGVWSLRLAELVVKASTPRGLWTIVVALIADGLLSLLEGWALLHGAWWGPWLVVVATGSLLPLEVTAFVRHAHPVRGAVLLVNTAIVVYLAWKAAREMNERREARARAESRALAAPSPPPRRAADKVGSEGAR